MPPRFLFLKMCSGSAIKTLNKRLAHVLRSGWTRASLRQSRYGAEPSCRLTALAHRPVPARWSPAEHRAIGPKPLIRDAAGLTFLTVGDPRLARQFLHASFLGRIFRIRDHSKRTGVQQKKFEGFLLFRLIAPHPDSSASPWDCRFGASPYI